MRRERRRRAVLRVLHETSRPLGSHEIVSELARRGIDLAERTVRSYLAEFRAEGLARREGRRGYVLTARGRQTLDDAAGLERVSLLSAKIDRMTFQMDFDLRARRGNLVANTTLTRRDALEACADTICEVFRKGYAMGSLLGLLGPGERVGAWEVPAGRVGFCTVCSITVNGVLLKMGIPVRSRFGGLLEIRDGRPVRFAEVILYDGTSIDPLEIFIRGRMTDYCGAVERGAGRIGASFREIPMESRETVVEAAGELRDAGLGAILEVGRPGAELYGIPVPEGRVGMVVVGGLNPASVLEERGYPAESRALCGFLPYERFFPYHRLRDELRKLQ
ncbi:MULTISPECIES: DUF128 domain-containing protein [Deferrisoma]